MRHALLFTSLAFAALAVSAEAAEVKVFVTGASKAITQSLAESFKAKTGHVIILTADTAGGVAKRVEAGEMLSYGDVQEILRIPLIGIIPESESVLHASNQGNPAIHVEGSDVSEAYKDVVARFLGEDKPIRFADYEKPGILSRIFGGK